MKPHLIKFSCPACGTRLAVPLSMAGAQDHCPKCSAVVAAPMPTVEPAVPATPELLPLKTEIKDPPAHGAAETKDTAEVDAPSMVRSAEVQAKDAAVTEEPASGLRASLLDEFLSGPTAPEAAPATAPKPVKKSRARQPRKEAAPEINVHPEPVQIAPAISDSPLSNDPGPIEDAPPIDPPADDAWNDPPEENLHEIGMGAALATHFSSPTLNVTRHVTPTLGVGLMQIADMPRHDRRTRRRRLLGMAVLIFLMIDAGVALWFFRHRIEGWFPHRDPIKVKTSSPRSTDDQVPSGPKKIEVAETTEPSPKPPAPVTPKPPENAVITATPEKPADSEIAKPLTEKLPEQVAIPVLKPAIAPLDFTPEKTPVEKVGPPPVVAKIDIEPPPPPPPPPVIADLSSPPSVTSSPVNSEESTATKSALEALKAFLAAGNFIERLRWCQRSDAVRPLMEKHYKSHPDGPVRYGKIDFIDSYPSKDGVPPYSMFEVSGGSLKQTVLALVEEKPKNEYRVDWEAFVEFKDGLLWEFLGKPVANTQKFRVVMRRKHYFDNDVPNVEKKDGFELVQPGSEVVAHVFVEQGTPVARQIAQTLGWDAKIPVTLELVWRTEGTHHWVEIQSVTSFGWRS